MQNQNNVHPVVAENRNWGIYSAVGGAVGLGVAGYYEVYEKGKKTATDLVKVAAIGVGGAIFGGITGYFWENRTNNYSAQPIQHVQNQVHPLVQNVNNAIQNQNQSPLQNQSPQQPLVDQTVLEEARRKADKVQKELDQALANAAAEKAEKDKALADVTFEKAEKVQALAKVAREEEEKKNALARVALEEEEKKKALANAAVEKAEKEKALTKVATEEKAKVEAENRAMEATNSKEQAEANIAAEREAKLKAEERAKQAEEKIITINNRRTQTITGSWDKAKAILESKSQPSNAPDLSSLRTTPNSVSSPLSTNVNKNSPTKPNVDLTPVSPSKVNNKPNVKVVLSGSSIGSHLTTPKSPLNQSLADQIKGGIKLKSASQRLLKEEPKQENQMDKIFDKISKIDKHPTEENDDNGNWNQ